MKKMDISEEERKRRIYISSKLYEAKKKLAKVCSELEELGNLETLLYRKKRIEHRIENLIKERNGEPFEPPLPRAMPKEEEKKERKIRDLSDLTEEEKKAWRKQQQKEWYQANKARIRDKEREKRKEKLKDKSKKEEIEKVNLKVDLKVADDPIVLKKKKERPKLSEEEKEAKKKERVKNREKKVYKSYYQKLKEKDPEAARQYAKEMYLKSGGKHQKAYYEKKKEDLIERSRRVYREQRASLGKEVTPRGRKVYNLLGEKAFIKFLQMMIDEGILLTTYDLTEKSEILPDYYTIRRRLKCNSWEEVLKKLDREEFIQEKSEHEKEKIKKEYIDISEKLNRPFGATKKELNEFTKMSYFYIYFLFGGLRGLRKECGFVMLEKREDVAKVQEDFCGIYNRYGATTRKAANNIIKNEFGYSLSIVLKAFKATKLSEVYDILEKKNK